MYYYLQLIREKFGKCIHFFPHPSQANPSGPAPQMDFPRFEFQDLPSPGTKVGAPEDRKDTYVYTLSLIIYTYWQVYACIW